ncbi:MAG: hypothetical protein SGI77_20430, partial [Pirellulaceae bacterium]|nr:hypothetical protein [Pirellulaceae bacterium]
FAVPFSTEEASVKLEMRPYLHLAWLEKRDVENHVNDRPHPAANSVQIARAAFPSTMELPSACKLSNNSSITNNLLLPTKSMSTIAQYPTTPRFTDVAASAVTISKTSGRDFGGIVCSSGPV